MSRSTLPRHRTDGGWPYPDSTNACDLVDDAEVDLDALELRADPHAFDSLSSLERTALFRRFGLRGETCLTMKQLGPSLGCTRSEARRLVGTAIDKVRTRLTAS